MNKRTKKALAIVLIAAVTISLAAFLIPFPKTGVFWAAYIAELIALGVQIPMFKYALENGESLNSKILGLPVYRAGYIYLGVQSAASLVLTIAGAAVPDLPVWIAVIVCVIIFAFAAISSITADIARDEALKIESSRKDSTAFIMSMRTLSEQLASSAADAELKKKLSRLAESFRFSDPVSSEKTSAAESSIGSECRALGDMLASGDIQSASAACDRIEGMLKERNALCKLGK